MPCFYLINQHLELPSGFFRAEGVMPRASVIDQGNQYIRRYAGRGVSICHTTSLRFSGSTNLAQEAN